MTPVTKSAFKMFARAGRDAHNPGTTLTPVTTRDVNIGFKTGPRYPPSNSPEKLLLYINRLDYDAAPQRTIDAPPAYVEAVSPSPLPSLSSSSS